MSHWIYIEISSYFSYDFLYYFFAAERSESLIEDDGGGGYYQESQQQSDASTLKATISSLNLVNQADKDPLGDFISSPPQSQMSSTAKNVTVAHGKTALLTCKVGAGLLDNRTVGIISPPSKF
jgi:hypothetical protein